ncbi:MAG: single-stranded DNA-binding protein [Candidatus Brennerbacteria bacterium]|nr:single-stranded DNA-binding protein [Candidatus Brennerbacteria bacterium]
MNLNKVFIIGRLTQDPQLRTTPSGTSVATISMATNRIWTNKNGERQQDVQYHNVVIWGRQAEIVNQFLKKGSMAMVEGRLQTRAWQDSKGQNRRTTEVVCERIQFGPRAAGAQASLGRQEFGGVASEESKEVLPEINIDEENIKPEDIPF